MVVVANTPSGAEQIPQKAENTLLVAVEDRSGAGFRIKQPLNAGQPVVSQVVMPPTDKAAHHSESCCWLCVVDVILISTAQQQKQWHGCVWKRVDMILSPLSLLVVVWGGGFPTHTPQQNQCGRNGKQASSATFCCDGL